MSNSPKKYLKKKDTSTKNTLNISYVERTLSII